MTRKTNTDYIFELKDAVTTLIARADKADETFDRIQVESLRERLTQIEVMITRLNERSDTERRDIERLEEGSSGAEQKLTDVDKRLHLVESDLARLEQRFDEILARRWELWKIILAAFLGSILALATSFLGRSLDRLIDDMRPATSETR